MKTIILLFLALALPAFAGENFFGTVTGVDTNASTVAFDVPKPDGVTNITVTVTSQTTITRGQNRDLAGIGDFSVGAKARVVTDDSLSATQIHITK